MSGYNFALAAALAERPDLILMDMMMPGAVDGLEATRRIKAQLGDACRVVMLSARGQEADRRAGSEAGADAYFVKPFSPLELLRTVEALVG